MTEKPDSRCYSINPDVSSPHLLRSRLGEANYSVLDLVVSLPCGTISPRLIGPLTLLAE